MFNILSQMKILRNANQNNSEIPSYTSKNGQDQKHRWQLMLERLWGKGNTSALLIWMQAGTTPLNVIVTISQKIKKQPSSRPSNTTFGYTSKRCSIMPQGHVLNYVYSSFVCHSQNLETTWTPLDRMKLGNNILSEVTLTQKDNYHMYSLIGGF